LKRLLAVEIEPEILKNRFSATVVVTATTDAADFAPATLPWIHGNIATVELGILRVEAMTSIPLDSLSQDHAENLPLRIHSDYRVVRFQ
jgi:hypothetical protein